MDYEKKYNEVLKSMKVLYNKMKYLSSPEALATTVTLEDNFPELKESEDEKIKKMLIRIFEKADMGGEIFGEGITYKQVIAWLEKQGQEKSIDMSIKEKAHQIAWETSKHYEPLLSKESWCEMAALDMAYWLEKQSEQKPTWSEEDELRCQSTTQVLEYARSLDAYNQYGKEDIAKNIDWLKSLKPNHWKPSEEQMRVLQIAIKDYGICHEKHVLESLYNNLKNI